jgi:hypothetical protein
MAKTKRYGKRKSHHKKKPAKRTRSKRGSGRMTRLQAGGQPVFVGAPWNGANTNTWGVTNHYAYNPQGSGSGDPLDIVLGTRSTKPGNMIGGKRRYRKKRRTTKKHHKKSSKRRHKRRVKRGGALIDDMNGPGNWVQNQIDRSIAGGSRRRRKGKKHVRKSRKSKRKHMKGGYAGDMPFQNTVNFFRGISNNLGNVVHGFRGYPEVSGPSPVDQPGMEPPRMPVPMPADIETLYKNAQTNVGSIGTV